MNLIKKIERKIIEKCQWGRSDQEPVLMRNKEKHKDEED